MYHRIFPRGTQPAAFSPNLELFVSEEQFEQQIEYLSRNHHCIGLDDAVTRLQRGTLPRGSVIVTFDDGYRDNLLALPILERYSVPATIYVTTGAVARTRTMWWDEQEAALAAMSSLPTPALKQRAFDDLNRRFKSMTPAQQDALMEQYRGHFDHETILSWDEVRSLDRHPLMTIGAHTVDHHVLTQLSAPELEYQLVTSRRELEHQLGHSVEHFAYPFGRAEHAARREFVAAARAGFKSAVTTRPGHWRRISSLHALPRIAVDYSDSMDDFAWKVSGGYVATEAPLRLARSVKSLVAAPGR